VELPGPATVEPEEFVGRVGQRQGHRQGVERVTAVADVGDRRTNVHDVGDGDLGGQGQTGDAVERVDGEGVAGDAVFGRHEPWRPTASTTAPPDQTGTADEAVGVQRHDADRRDRAERPGDGGSAERCVEPAEIRVVAEWHAPVEEGRGRRGDVDDDIERRAAEMDER
jgi:hypothetical protein